MWRARARRGEFLESRCGSIDAVERGRLKMFDQLIPSLREMQSRSMVFVETAQLRFNLRMPPGIIPSEVETLMREQLQDGRAQNGRGCLAYRPRRIRRWCDRSGGDSTARRLAHVHGEIGTSDMNITAPVWQCPAVAYGPAIPISITRRTSTFSFQNISAPFKFWPTCCAHYKSPAAESNPAAAGSGRYSRTKPAPRFRPQRYRRRHSCRSSPACASRAAAD